MRDTGNRNIAGDLTVQGMVKSQKGAEYEGDIEITDPTKGVVFNIGGTKWRLKLEQVGPNDAIVRADKV